jgi:hypothetical protein
MTQSEAAAPPLSSRLSAVRGYGAAPPASRVATAIATRRVCRPPLTPEPLRPLTAQRHGQAQKPLPAQPHGAQHLTKIKSLRQKSLRFQGIAMARSSCDCR